MKFGPLSELTKGFSPERWTRIEKIMADMQVEEDRQAAAESGNRPGAAVTGRPAGASKDSAGTGR